MMRRNRAIVNEMEFRMLYARKSLSPPLRATTMKRFLARSEIVDGLALTLSAQTLNVFDDAHIAF